MAWLISFAWVCWSYKEHKSKREIQKQNSCPHRDSDQVPSAYEADALPMAARDLIPILCSVEKIWWPFSVVYIFSCQL